LSRIAKRHVAGDDSGLDYSDIPPLTDEQLAQFRRTPKVLVAARLAWTATFTTGSGDMERAIPPASMPSCAPLCPRCVNADCFQVFLAHRDRSVLEGTRSISRGVSEGAPL
jgi:hypothetical protein